MSRLTAATPRKYVGRWLFVTALYSCCILINEHFELIAALGLSQAIQAVIRLMGALVYIFLTTYSFQKTNDDTYTEPFQIPHDLAADNSTGPALTGTPGGDDAQGDNTGKPQSTPDATNAATNPVN